VATSFRLTGEMGAMAKELMARQRQSTVWAIDTSVASGFAPHLGAGCDTGGLTGSSLEQLKAKERALNKGAEITDSTVGGKPAFRSAHTATGRDGITADSVTVRVPVSADRYCYLEVEAEHGDLPAGTDQIIKSFRLA
jgi:hypothetical protein